MTPLIFLLLLGADPNAAAPREELASVVKTAFRETHDGWSADEVLVNDQLNAAFIAHCRRSAPKAREFDLNWTLLNLRKAGGLDAKATKRKTTRHDNYGHAAEIAARWMFDKHQLTVDRVLCDPEQRKEFDRIAQAAAPGVEAYRLRKAALSLRKTRKLRPELTA